MKVTHVVQEARGNGLGVEAQLCKDAGGGCAVQQPRLAVQAHAAVERKRCDVEGALHERVVKHRVPRLRRIHMVGSNTCTVKGR